MAFDRKRLGCFGAVGAALLAGATLFFYWRSLPSPAKAAYDRGVALRKINMLTDARQAFTESIRANPRYAPPHRALAEMATELKNFPEAARHWQELAALAPDSAGVYARLAYAQLMAGQEVDALKNAEKQLQTEPNNGMAHLIAGVLYARKGTPKIALEHLEPAAKEFPNDPQVQMTFARLLTRSGNYDKAEQTLKAILVKNKAFAEPLYLLGFIALRRPDTPENRQNAEKQLRAALELEPTYPEANFELAKLMMRLGRYQDALPFSEKAATNRKHYPAAWQQLTQIYEKLGRASDAERARKLFAAQSERIARERTLLRRYSADPNNVANLLELVDTELALEKMNEASMFMQDVMRIAPNDPRVQEFIKKKNAEMEAQQKSQPGGAEGAASPGGQALPENAPPIGGMPPSGAMPPGRTRPPSSNASPSIAPPAGGGVPSLNNAPPR